MGKSNSVIILWVLNQNRLVIHGLRILQIASMTQSWAHWLGWAWRTVGAHYAPFKLPIKWKKVYCTRSSKYGLSLLPAIWYQVSNTYVCGLEVQYTACPTSTKLQLVLANKLGLSSKIIDLNPAACRSLQITCFSQKAETPSQVPLILQDVVLNKCSLNTILK